MAVFLFPDVEKFQPRHTPQRSRTGTGMLHRKVHGSRGKVKFPRPPLRTQIIC